jgi:hypothetical protein
VDFALGSPSPSALIVNSGSISNSATMQVTAQGAFNATVTLSCAGLVPLGANCHFSPSDTVQPTSASPVTVTMWVSTVEDTPASTSNFNVVANTAGAPAPKTQTLSLTVKIIPDYKWQVQSASVLPGSSATMQVSFQPVNGYKGTVNTTCDASAADGASCSVSPTSVSLAHGAGSATLNVNVPRSALVGTYPVNLSTHDTSGAPTHNFAAMLTVNADFSVTVSNSSVAVSAGQTAEYHLQVVGVGGAFNDQVAFLCSDHVSGSNCSFSPPVITPAAGTANVLVSVSTMAPVPTLAMFHPPQQWKIILINAVWTLPLCGLLATGLLPFSWKRRLRLYFGLLILFTLSLAEMSCGGGGSSNSPPPRSGGTPPGTYTVKVTAASPTITHSSSLTLVVQ